MKQDRKLLVISEGFPNPNNPCRYTFVEQLVNKIAQRNISVTVVNPVYHNYIRYQYREEWSYKVPGGRQVNVYQPKVLNFSSRKIGPLNMMGLSYLSFCSAVRNVMIQNNIRPDVVYSHFVFPSGCAAASIGAEMGIPSFCATGESDLSEIISRVGVKFLKKKLSHLQGIISVSSENKMILSEGGFFDPNAIVVLPNCVDQALFYPHDKEAMRKKYGFPDGQIIGAFLGAYSDRKGVKRVNCASDLTGIPMIYIGEGELQPNGTNVLFSGAVRHDLIPEYLSAADFFILPTKNEGCCNAIIEAICCGLPVISSKGSFNDDILNDDYSIRIDPNDVEQIADAMRRMADDTVLRRNMTDKAVQQRELFNLDHRADRILQFTGLLGQGSAGQN